MNRVVNTEQEREREQAMASVARMTKTLNTCLDMLKKAGGQIDECGQAFGQRRQLVAKAVLAKSVITAAINHLEKARPRMYMVDEEVNVNPSPLPPKNVVHMHAGDRVKFRNGHPEKSK